MGRICARDSIADAIAPRQAGGHQQGICGIPKVSLRTGAACVAVGRGVARRAAIDCHSARWTALTAFSKMLRLNYGNRNKRTTPKVQDRRYSPV